MVHLSLDTLDNSDLVDMLQSLVDSGEIYTVGSKWVTLADRLIEQGYIWPCKDSYGRV